MRLLPGLQYICDGRQPKFNGYQSPSTLDSMQSSAAFDLSNGQVRLITPLRSDYDVQAVTLGDLANGPLQPHPLGLSILPLGQELCPVRESVRSTPRIGTLSTYVLH